MFSKILCIFKESAFAVAKFGNLESLGISPKEPDRSQFGAVFAILLRKCLEFSERV